MENALMANSKDGVLIESIKKQILVKLKYLLFFGIGLWVVVETIVMMFFFGFCGCMGGMPIIRCYVLCVL